MDCSADAPGRPEGLGPEAFGPFSFLEGRNRERALGLGRIVEPRPGRPFLYQGDLGAPCALVLSGSLRAVMRRTDGSAVGLGVSGPGEWAGLAECLLDCPVLADREPGPRTRLFVLEPMGLKALRNFPGTDSFLLMECARRSYALHARVELRSPRELIVMRLKELEGDDGLARITQDALALDLGITRETVNRKLKDLEREGALEVERGAVRLLRPLGR